MFVIQEVITSSGFRRAPTFLADDGERSDAAEAWMALCY
jgi:hypothetical protein